jgi:magnesium-transporting ATPase (P-type)
MVVVICVLVFYWFLNQCLLWQEFAGEGLRTLAIAYRDLDDKYFKEWHKMLEDANAAIDKREEQICGLYEEIERDLMV